jgi:hypothetical protein
MGMGRKEETLIEPFAVQEYFVDGFDGYEVKDGILTCAGYRLQKPCRQNGDPLKVVIMRIVMPVANLAAVVTRATDAARRMPGLTEYIGRTADKLSH